MNYTYYIFAIFVGLLVVAIVVLNDRLRRSRAEREEAIKAKEQRLFQLFNNLEDMVDSLEEYATDIKRDLQREKVELTQLLKEMQEMQAAPPPQPVLPPPLSLVEQVAPPEEPAVKKAAPRKAQKPKVQPVTALSKAEQVRQLSSRGYTVEHIAHELVLSRGEVDLILGLYQQRN